MRIRTIASTVAEILATVEPPREPRTAEEAGKYLMHAVDQVGGKSSWQLGNFGFFRAYFDLQVAKCFLMTTSAPNSVELELVFAENPSISDPDVKERFSIGSIPLHKLPAVFHTTLKRAKKLAEIHTEIVDKIARFNKNVIDMGGSDRLYLKAGA